jgi:D-alanyl-D-alanine carboxypeptidase/D-alanyl-D-alanine-endopeptidase (penicillin-binding protein 4)
MRRLLVIALLVVTPLSVWSQSLADRLQGILDDSELTDRMVVGMQVADVETGEILFGRMAHNLLTPASNVKLYTSACALETYGPDHRFRTVVALDGEVNDGVLDGDLILTGDGDPILTSEDLRGIAQRVHDELGIRQIDGGVVVDDSRVAQDRKGPGWMWDDDPGRTNMSIASLMLDYNVLRATAANGTPMLEPPSDYPPAEHHAANGETSISRWPFRDVIEVHGDGAASAVMGMHDPATWIGHVFTRMLEDAGVDVEDDPLVETDPLELEAALVHESKPMSEILPLFNKPSENAIGEMLILSFASRQGERPATWRTGARAMGTWLTQTAGLTEDDFRLVDGSGLSRYNLICASGAVKLLRHMWQSPNRQVYIDSLPIMGGDGTLGGRGASLNTGSVHAKTGTMSGVSALSGYVETAQGRWLVFSILTNGFIGSSSPSRALQDRLCAAMAAGG